MAWLCSCSGNTQSFSLVRTSIRLSWSVLPWLNVVVPDRTAAWVESCRFGVDFLAVIVTSFNVVVYGLLVLGLEY